jgi:hypothetical protein
MFYLLFAKPESIVHAVLIGFEKVFLVSLVRRRVESFCWVCFQFLPLIDTSAGRGWKKEETKFPLVSTL